MVRRCHELDPTRVVSAAVNGDNEKGVSDALDIIGFNYGLNRPDGFHKKHPTRPIYGSETASTIATRGVYQTDPLRNTLSAYDVNHTDWSELAEEWWTFYATREWEAGGFAWTGFDYRGEPTPYGWPSINSQFGIVDMCGFPKDDFFYYKAWWTQGAACCTCFRTGTGRAGKARRFLCGSTRISTRWSCLSTARAWAGKRFRGSGTWSGRCATSRARSRRRDGKTASSLLTEKRETTGPVASLRLTADRTTINADGEDVAVLTVDALDSAGRAVPTASNLINFKVTGEGALIGVGNGDPNCQESDKEPRRSLFNGLAQAIVQSTKTAGTIKIEASTIVRGNVGRAGQAGDCDEAGGAAAGRRVKAGSKGARDRGSETPQRPRPVASDPVGDQATKRTSV